MADERMRLQALLEKTADANLLNEMIGFAANSLMELEADGLCNAGRHERSAERTNWRNGYRDRAWETRAGTVDLKIPKLRKGSYFLVFLEHRRTSERGADRLGGDVRRYAFLPEIGDKAGGVVALVGGEREAALRARILPVDHRQCCLTLGRAGSRSAHGP